jgi:hypothetical protein
MATVQLLLQRLTLPIRRDDNAGVMPHFGNF